VIVRKAYWYVRALFVLESILFISAVTLHICISVGTSGSMAGFSRPLFNCALVTAIPATALAEEKNVFRNEFKSCPLWLRALTVTVDLYVAGVALISISTGLLDSHWLLSAVPLFFSSMPLCILYSLLWASPLGGSELLKRVRVSLGALVICAAVIAAWRLGLFPRRPAS
jgi:hypothetical protein